MDHSERIVALAGRLEGQIRVYRWLMVITAGTTWFLVGDFVISWLLPLPKWMRVASSVFDVACGGLNLWLFLGNRRHWFHLSNARRSMLRMIEARGLIEREHHFSQTMAAFGALKR